MSKQPNQSTAIAKELSPEELNAKIALTGNLADLTPAQQMEYYARYCKHLGLDPITRPFDLLTTFEENGTQKTVLYANASCSAQLADARHVTYGRPELEHNEKLGLITINVQAQMITDAGIRSCWRRGVAHIEGLKGRRLENAIKKAETQAHRRATLALCGVAMPDESEIEDIHGAQASSLQVDSATGGIYEKIGELLRSKSMEDSSGARRFILDGLASGAYQGVANLIGVPIEIIEDLSRQIEKKRQIAEAREKHIPTPAKPEFKPIVTLEREDLPKPAPYLDDPVPALKPTLTATQQKVSDAVTSLLKEHKRAKAETLLVIEKFLGRPVKASKDLSDEEAEKVFGHLQTLAAQLSAEKKPEATKTVYDQKNRAHNAELATAIDEAIKRLTVLGVPFGPVAHEITDMVEREVSGRKIENRYALNDEEARAVLEFLQQRILDRENEADAAHEAGKASLNTAQV